MKNPLIFPIAILMAALLVLVATIIMTPPIVEKQDPAFDQITDGYTPAAVETAAEEEAAPAEAVATEVIPPAPATPDEVLTPVPALGTP